MFPTFGCLFIDAVRTGKGDQASKIPAVGEAYFKRTAVYNSFDANFEVINPEFVAGADLFVYENRNLIIPNEKGLFDFNRFAQEVNLNAVDLAPFYREVAKQKNKKFLITV